LSRFTKPGKDKKVKEREMIRVSVLSQADGHPFVTCLGLCPVGAEKSIPPGKVESKVAVIFFDQNGVVDTVHLGRDHEKPENAVDRNGKPHISMIEHARGIEKDLEENNREDRRTNEDDSHHLNTHGEKDLNRMKSDSCGDIEVQIGMMNPVKSPEQRNEMEHYMLKVYDKIEGKNTDGNLQPVWE
jgi:hypothetical protein